MSDQLYYFLEEVNKGEYNHYVMKNCHRLVIVFAFAISIIPFLDYERKMKNT